MMNHKTRPATKRRAPSLIDAHMPGMRIVDPQRTGAQFPDTRAARAFFEAHRAELARAYPDEFVVIFENAVLDHDSQLFVLGERVRERTGRANEVFFFTGDKPPRFVDGFQQPITK